jgi:hypothetical protein
MDGGSARRKAGTYTKENANTEQTQTSMPGVGLEHMFPAFEQPKTVHAFYNAATVTGAIFLLELI